MVQFGREGMPLLSFFVMFISIAFKFCRRISKLKTAVLSDQMTTRLLVGTYGEKLGHVDGKGKGIYSFQLQIGRNKSGELVASLKNELSTGTNAFRMYFVNIVFLEIFAFYTRDGVACAFVIKFTDSDFVKSIPWFPHKPLITTGEAIAGHDCALNPTAIVAYGKKIFAVDELYDTTGSAVEIELSDGENNGDKVG